MSGADYKTPLKRFLGANWTALVRFQPACRDVPPCKSPFGVWIGVDEPYTSLQANWCKSVCYQFTVLHATDETKNIQSLRHTYRFDRSKVDANCKFLDQGFAECFVVAYNTFMNPASGYVNSSGEFSMKIDMELIYERTRCPLNHDPKKVTGMVGLENQGATCYLNALLQMLFHISEFRKAVYMLPVPESSVAVESSTTLALQSIFHNLQTKDCEVNTRDLTRAFGWTSSDAFMQQDVQEMLRVLLDKLEEKMTGTVVDGTIKRLFAGKVRSFIRCVNVTYESARDEDYYDIQLDVKGCKDVNESFARYVEKEMLDGDNKYDAGPEFGKQDAEKGVTFMSFPPVLTMHLKRFAFDFERMGFTKIHDRYEFPVLLDLNEYISPDADPAVKAIDHTYELHSVLVHSGDVHGGHYYAYIRPANKHTYGQDPTTLTARANANAGKWFMFNDEHVYEVHKKEAVDMCFGGGRTNSYGVSHEQMASAYMLVYVRVDSGKELMAPSASSVEDIPPALSLRLDGQQQKEMMERYNNLLDDQFTEVYYWLESDVAHFSNYYKSSAHGDFLDPHQKRKLIIPKMSSYVGVYLKLLEELKLKPWQLWIFPFNHNVNNKLVDTKKAPIPLRGMDQVCWFYKDNVQEYTRYLNQVPDSSHMYVHITEQFEPGSHGVAEFNHAAVEASYQRFREIEQELVKEIHDACVATKNPFEDEALNAKPFDYTYKCGLGSYPWSLHLLKPTAVSKKLITTLHSHAVRFCFNDVMTHLAALVGKKRLTFFKAYDPSGYLSFPCNSLPKLLTEHAMIYQGRMMTDVRGEWQSDSFFLTDEEQEADAETRKKMLIANAKQKHRELVSGYASKSNVVRYVGSSFLNNEIKLESLPKFAQNMISHNYQLYLNSPKAAADGHISAQNAQNLMDKYWNAQTVDLHMFDYPLIEGCCLVSPDPSIVGGYTTAENRLIKMSDITVREYATAWRSVPNPTNIIYISHHSKETVSTDQQIVNLNQYDAEKISVASYMSYLFHLRKLTIIPDEGGREVLARLARESLLLASKKKRSRATLNAGAGTTSVSMGSSGEEASSPLLATSELEMIKEDNEVGDNTNGGAEDALMRQFTVPGFDINTNISLDVFFDAVADMFSPHLSIDAQRLLFVPTNTRVNQQSWQFAPPGAWATKHPHSLPPLLPLDTVSLYSELGERKTRKGDSTLMFRVTPFPTTVDVPSTNSEQDTIKVSLMDVQQRQFEISINDSRILSLRRHFLSLYRIFSGLVSSEDISPLSPEEDEDAVVVSNMMKSSLSTGATTGSGKRLKGECDRVSPMMMHHKTGADANPLSNPASLQITTATSITTYGSENKKQVIFSDSNMKLDTTYMEDLYGLLWPLSLTTALPNEFITLRKVYVRIDGRVDYTVESMLTNVRNAMGIPVHASNDPNVSNIKRGPPTTHGSVSSTETRSRDDANDSTTVTTTTITTEPVNAPYVSDNTGTTNYSDHRWLNTMLTQWLDASTTNGAVGDGAHVVNADISTGTHLISAAVSKLSQFLRGTTLLLYRYDSMGTITYIYSKGSSIDALPRCWMDVHTHLVQTPPVIAGPQPAPVRGHALPRAQAMKRFDYVAHNSNLAVQFLGENELLLWEGGVPGVRSFGVFVYNIQTLTPHPAHVSAQNRWTSLDAELYGEPLISYICDTDTIESVTQRICALSPYAAGKQDVNMGFLKGTDISPLWFSEVAETMRAESEDDFRSQSTAEESSLSTEPTGACSLWDILTRVFPDATCPFKERMVKQQQLQQVHTRGSFNRLPCYFPLVIGIERPMLASSTVTKSETRMRKVNSSIKISG